MKVWLRLSHTRNTTRLQSILTHIIALCMGKVKDFSVKKEIFYKNNNMYERFSRERMEKLDFILTF